jgi:hypothetical protein
MRSYRPCRPPVLIAAAFVLAAWSTAAATGFDIDSAQRELVRQFYRTVYAASDGVAPGWTGDHTTGQAGSISEDYTEAVRLRASFFRAMAGVPSALEMRPEWAVKAQQAALMMSVNDSLSHAPPNTWTFFTQDGYDAAANGNLALGKLGPDAVDGYVRDFGPGNEGVGHRRWLMHPPSVATATGDVPAANGFKAANVMWVVDTDTYWKPWPATRSDGYYAWPPAGYVPDKLVYARWSLTVPYGDFSASTVTLQSSTRGPVPATIVFVGNNQYPDSTLVWEIDGIDANAFPPIDWPAVDADETVTVVVGPVQTPGGPRIIEYPVIIFNASQPAIDSVPTVVSGATAPLVSRPYTYAVSAVPFAEGSELRYLQDLGPASPFDAEWLITLHFEVATSPGYEVRQQELKNGGNYAYHLAAPDAMSQSLVSRLEYLIAPTTRLEFASHLGYAPVGQIFSVGVSVDEGQSWDTVWQVEGNGSLEQPSMQFTPVSIDLAAYAGSTVRVRFRVDTGGAYYTETFTAVGWVFDDVTLTDARSVAAGGIEYAADNRPSARFYSTDAQWVQARPLVFGGFPMPWSSALAVTPQANPPYVALVVGDWVNDAHYGWLYGVSERQAYSAVLGWLDFTHQPWVHRIGDGWLDFVHSSPLRLWLYSPIEGWLQTPR